jgi:cholesterol transport system auxiliary component
VSRAAALRSLLGMSLALLALGACTGSLFHSSAPPPSTYLLSVKSSAAAAADIPADLTVLMPRVRTGLDTEHIAALYPNRRLDYFAGARWSGPLDEVIQDLALQSFRIHAGFRDVHTDTSAFGAGYWLEIDVVDFQAEYAAGGSDGAAPTAHVHLLARVGNAGDRRVLGEFQAEVRQPAADNRLTAIVEAYNQAAEAALAQLGDDTVRTLKASLEAR